MKLCQPMTHLIPKPFSVLTSIFPVHFMAMKSVPPFPEVLFFCVQNVMFSTSNLLLCHYDVALGVDIELLAHI